LNTVQRCRLLRQFDELSAVWSDQQSVIGLQVSADLTKGSQLVCWIEEQKPSQFRMLHRGDKRSAGDTIGQLDRKNRVIKTVVRRRVCCNGSSLSINDDVVGLRADRAEHGTHQCCLVLAVTVAVGKDIGCGMRLPATNAKLDGDVTNFVLHE